MDEDDELQATLELLVKEREKWIERAWYWTDLYTKALEENIELRKQLEEKR